MEARLPIEYLDRDAIKMEIRKRKLERSFREFFVYYFQSKFGKFPAIKYHTNKIIELFQKIVEGEIKNAVINIPPRYGKTEIFKAFVLWSIARYSRSKFIHLSGSDMLALDNSDEIRQDLKSIWFLKFWDIPTKKSADAKQKWYTQDGGGMYATSTGGQITGFGAGESGAECFAGAIIIDDPQKAQEAHQENYRKSTNKRLNTTILSRRNEPTKTPIILIMQRLHEDDMTGYVLNGGTEEDFYHLCLPAIMVDEDTGEESALWSEKHTLDHLFSMRAADSMSFAGQYMQEPAPDDGELFKRENWRIVNAYPKGATVRGYDLAASTGKGSAYTASVKIVKHGSDFYIVDVQNDRLKPHEVEANMLLNAKLDGKKVKIDFPQDPGQAGKFQKEYMISKLLGYIAESTPETGSKESRAKGLSSQQAIGNVYIVKGAWNKEFIDQCATFPNGKYKDMVDAASRAFHSVLEFDSSGFDDTDENEHNFRLTEDLENEFF
jgi:predicted phage terminase large subunit-like protein